MSLSAHLPRPAPALLGAFLLPLLAISCREKDRVADWAGNSPAVAAVQVATTAPKAAKTPAREASLVRFVSYNVENWLTMDRQVDGKSVKGAPKPLKERQAIARLLAEARPDLLGISEIGAAEDLRDLQRFLEKAGHPMPHAHLHHGVDPTRGLAFLSRHPIVKTVRRETLTYRSQGREHGMQRGILDATVATPAGEFRFLGVHLKSKRETEDGDQADMRLHEAHLLRREIDAILRDDPRARLVVYGDLNDSRQSPAVRTIHGRGKNPESLMMIALKDSRGHYWTHHWEFQDIYSRIDYVMVSQALRGEVVWDRCAILDGEGVAGASDHRPLLVIFR
jgi:endonuclease/exonuclease/phosphatase family metal-dependent hydrolase